MPDDPEVPDANKTLGQLVGELVESICDLGDRNHMNAQKVAGRIEASRPVQDDDDTVRGQVLKARFELRWLEQSVSRMERSV